MISKGAKEEANEANKQVSEELQTSSLRADAQEIQSKRRDEKLATRFPLFPRLDYISQVNYIVIFFTKLWSIFEDAVTRFFNLKTVIFSILAFHPADSNKLI